MFNTRKCDEPSMSLENCYKNTRWQACITNTQNNKGGSMQMIMYFSGTGNSRYAAEIISMVAGDELVSINELIKTKSTAEIKSKKPFIFVAPIYGGRIPKVVETYIKDMKFEGNKDAYFVVTCAASAWNAKKYAQKLCREKGFAFLGLNSVIMPQNHLTMLDTKSDAENDKIIEAAALQIAKIAEVINNQNALQYEKSSNKLMSALLNPLMYYTIISAKRFYTSDKCKSCGQCVGRCPLNNVTMVSGKPHWEMNCTHCMACIGGCTCKAIEYGKKTSSRNRYYNTKKPLT